MHNNSNSSLLLNNKERSSDGGFAEVNLPEGALSQLNSSSADSVSFLNLIFK